MHLHYISHKKVIKNSVTEERWKMMSNFLMGIHIHTYMFLCVWVARSAKSNSSWLSFHVRFFFFNLMVISRSLGHKRLDLFTFHVWYNHIHIHCHNVHLFPDSKTTFLCNERKWIPSTWMVSAAMNILIYLSEKSVWKKVMFF